MLSLVKLQITKLTPLQIDICTKYKVILTNKNKKESIMTYKIGKSIRLKKYDHKELANDFWCTIFWITLIITVIKFI